MNKAWNIFKWTVIGITGIFLATVVFLFLYIDPNDYRDDASKLVKEKTGLVLQIGGKIGWQVYPAIGFSVADISLATAEGEPAIASVGNAAVSVELIPLFSQQINVRTLYVDKLVANLVVDAEGKGNWEALTASTPAEEPAPESKPADVTVRIPKVVVSNTIIDFENQKTLAHQTVTIQELVAEDLGLGHEFPFHLIGKLEDRSGINVTLDTRAFLTLHPDAQVYNVRGFELVADVGGILAKPFHLTLGADLAADMTAQKIGISRMTMEAADLAVTARPLTVKLDGPIAVDLAADTAKVGPIAFSAAGVNGTLDVAATQLTKELAFTGNLDISPFNAKNAMRTVGITPPETTDPMAMTKVALKTALEGALTRAMLNNLVITLDDTKISGNAGLTDLATKAIAFDIKVDAINADRYLPPAAKQPAAGKTAAAKPAEATAAAPAKSAANPGPLLPVDTLRTLNVDGKLGVGKIALMEWPMTNLALTLKAKDGDIRLDPFSASVLEGTVNGNVRINAAGSDPHIVTNLKLNRIEVGGVVKRYAKRDLLTGKTSLNLAVDTRGNDMDTLIKRAVGTVDFSFADAVLKGANLNGLLTETLSQQLGAFSMLVPDYQQKLPKELHQDTAFQTLTAKASVKDGIAQIPAFNAALKDAAVRGNGQFNLLSMDFDYTIAMRTDRLKDNKYLANMEFPLHCRGNISGAPADWCRPDGKAITGALKDAAEKAAKDRLKGELAKRLGIESTDTAAIKAEVKKQVDAEVEKQKDAVEQKAKEQLNKEMQKAFQKFF